MGEVIEIDNDEFLARVYSENSEGSSLGQFEDYVNFNIFEVEKKRQNARQDWRNI